MAQPTPPTIVETSFHVRYAETDAMGIVHHASYIVYFEEGRSAYIRHHGTSYAEFEQQGFYLAVTGINARYHKPARYDDLITIRTWVSQTRSRGLTFTYELINANTERLVTGTSEHICLDRQGNITKMPEDWLLWSS